ncbi:MAG: PKD domain-containing protein [bacterium]
MLQTRLLTLFVAMLSLSALIGCGGSGPDIPPGGAGRDFSASLLEQADTRFGSIGSVSLRGTPETLLVELNGLQDARAAYVELTYDSARWQLDDSSLPGLGSESSLSLVGELRPGILQLGTVLIDPLNADGVDGDLLLAELRFTDAKQAQRRSSLVNIRNDAAPDLSVNPITGELSWHASNPGDYDQNGLVSISDLTPLGINFGASGPFGIDTAQWVVDGDGNNEINISDISPIGANFGNQVSEYRIFSSMNLQDYPASNGADPVNETLEGNVAVGSGSGNPASQRLAYAFSVGLDPGTSYWVRAWDGSSYGTASAHVGSAASGLTLALNQLASPDAVLGGDGTEFNPYIVQPLSEYRLEVEDSANGLVTPVAVFSINGNPEVSGTSGSLQTGATDKSAFSVSASYNGQVSNTLSFIFLSQDALLLDVDPASANQPLAGSGSLAEPLAILPLSPVQLRLRDGSGTDLTANPEFSYKVNSADTHSVSLQGELSMDLSAIAQFSIVASNGSKSSNELQIRPVLVNPPILSFDTAEPPVPGDGSGGNPLQLGRGKSYDLSVIGLFGVEADNECSFTVDPASMASIGADGVMTVDAAATDFSVTASHKGVLSNTLFCSPFDQKTYTFSLSPPALSGSGTELDPYEYYRDNSINLELGNLDGPAPNPQYAVSDPGMAQLFLTDFKILKTATADGVFFVSASHGQDIVENGQIYIRALNNPPVAAFSMSQSSGTLPLDISFDGSATTDNESSNLTYNWNLDPDINFEATGQGLFLTKGSYLEAGTYEIKLLVTDPEGASSEATQMLTVNAGPSWQETKVSSRGSHEANLVPISGGPGILTDDPAWQDFHYGDAPEGGNFTSLQDFTAETDIGEFGEARIKILSNVPVACYTVRDQNTLETYVKFVKATDTVGSSWGTPVIVSNAVSLGICDMAIMSATQIVIFYVDSTGNLVSRFSLTGGDNWSPASVVDGSGTIAPDIAADAAGFNPCVIYHNGSDIVYREGDESLGVNWTAPPQIVKAGATASGFSLLCGSNPVAAWIDKSTASSIMLNHTRRLNGSWIAPFLRNQGSVAVAPQFAVVDGKPSLLFGLPDGTFMVRAHDTDAASFTDSHKVSERIPGGLGLAMIGSFYGVSLTDPNHVSDNGTFFLSLH